MLARLLGVGGDRFIRHEVAIALDWKTESTSHRLQFDKRDVTEFWLSHTKIAETEGDVAVGIEFRQEPGALGVRGKEFHDGLEVECCLAFVHCGELCSAVDEQLFGECIGDEFHGRRTGEEQGLSWQDRLTSSRAICTAMAQIQDGLTRSQNPGFRKRHAHSKIIFEWSRRRNRGRTVCEAYTHAHARTLPRKGV